MGKRRHDMALPGELNGLDGTICEDCGAELQLCVCRSAAGYYLGYWCHCSGPVSREAGYYDTLDEARDNLEKVRRGEVPDKCRQALYEARLI